MAHSIRTAVIERASISRRLLQVAAALSAVQAMAGGGLYLCLGIGGLSIVTGSPLPIQPADPGWAVIDTMFRALAGIWFVLGLMLAYIVPSIEKHGTWFALVFAAIFAMGIGRAFSVLKYGLAPGNLLGAMITEFVLPPILALWQRSVAKAHAATGSPE